MDYAPLLTFYELFLQDVFEAFYRAHAALTDSLWLTIAVGLLLCFFGIKIFSASLFWFAAVAGGLLCYGLGKSMLDTVPALVCALIGGAALGFLLRALVRIGFFLAGILAGALIGTALLGNSIWVAAVIAAFGIISLVAYRYFIVVATAAWGAALLIDTTLPLFGPAFMHRFPAAVFALKAILFAGGMAYQLELVYNKSKEAQERSR